MSKRAADETSDPPPEARRRVVAERRSSPTEQRNANVNNGSTARPAPARAPDPAPAPPPAPLPVAAAHYVQRNPQDVVVPLVDAVIMTDNGLTSDGNRRAPGAGSASSNSNNRTNNNSSGGKSNANTNSGNGPAAPAPAPAPPAGLAANPAPAQRSSPAASGPSNTAGAGYAAPRVGGENRRNPIPSDRVPISAVCGSPHFFEMMRYGFRTDWGSNTVNREELLGMLQDGGAHLAVRCMTAQEMESLAMRERSVIRAGRYYEILNVPDNVLEHCKAGLSHLRHVNVFGATVDEETIDIIIEESQTVAARNLLLPAEE